jgi:hypothetical protein
MALGGCLLMRVGMLAAKNHVFSTSNQERLRITSAGLVGIGTSSPDAQLDVTRSGNGQIAVLQTTAGRGFNFESQSDTQIQISSILGSTNLDLWANTVSLSAGGSQRLFVDSAGNVGIGTTSPSALLHVVGIGGAIRMQDTTATSKYIQMRSDLTNSHLEHIGGPGDALRINNQAAGTIEFFTSGIEKARIDSSGRLLVGTSSARENFYNSTNSARFQIEGSGSNDNYALSIVSNYAGNTSGAQVIFAKSGGSSVGDNTLVSDGNTIGQINFQGADGTEFVEAAKISAEVDGTPGANDMPGRLVFSTTADGASSTTERMRIGSNGAVAIGTTSTIGAQLAVVSDNATKSPISTNGVSGDLSYQAILVTKFDNNTTTSQNFIQFQVNNGAANCGRITANGANTAAFGSTSDIRLKENIEDLPPQLQNILNLRPVEFDYTKSEGGGHQIGFIAQEMQAVYPDVVNERGEDDMLMITGWSKTEARLVKAIQEQQAMIAELQAEVAALKAQ